MGKRTLLIAVVLLALIAIGCKDGAGPDNGKASLDEKIAKSQPQSPLPALPDALKPQAPSLKPIQPPAPGSPNAGPRFSVSPDGVIADSQYRMEWFVGPDKDITWDQAQDWSKKLSVGGKKWRLPLMGELATLYQPGMGARNMDPIFKISAWYVWALEISDPKNSWTYNFNSGIGSLLPNKPLWSTRAFAVRQY